MCTWGTNYKDGKFHYCKGLDVIKADNVVSVLLVGTGRLKGSTVV